MGTHPSPLAGAQLGTLPVPSPFLPVVGTRGCATTSASRARPRRRTAASCSPERKARRAGRPAASLGVRSPARILRYNLQTGKLDRQYSTGRTRSPSRLSLAGAFGVNGLVDLLPLNNQHLLAMERSFPVGAPDTGNTIKLYSVKLQAPQT